MPRQIIVPRLPRTGLVSPLEISGCRVWCDAKAIGSITYDGANRVSQWSDRSGRGNHLLQATGAGQPLLVLGPRNYLEFDGVDDSLKATAFTLNQPETVVIVARRVAAQPGRAMYDGNVNDSMQLFESGANVIAYAGSSGPSTPFATGTFAALINVFNGASSTGRKNTAAVTTGNTNTANAGGFILGANASASGSNTQFCEVIIYAGALSEFNQLRLANLLIRKWNL